MIRSSQTKRERHAQCAEKNIVASKPAIIPPIATVATTRRMEKTTQTLSDRKHTHTQEVFVAVVV